MHCFCDASKLSFRCCVYLVHKLDYSAEVQLIFSKGRVAPIQSRTIPALKLMATVVGNCAILLVRDALNVEINKHIVWCDATTVLQWLTSRKVQSQLQKASNLIYRYVPPQDNPANVLSRAQRALELCKNELWWHGPLWLSQECLWPTLPPNVSQFETSVKSTVILTSKRVKLPDTLLSDKFEKWYSLWRSYINFILRLSPIAWCYRKCGLNSAELFKCLKGLRWSY